MGPLVCADVSELYNAHRPACSQVVQSHKHADGPGRLAKSSTVQEEAPAKMPAAAEATPEAPIRSERNASLIGSVKNLLNSGWNQMWEGSPQVDGGLEPKAAGSKPLERDNTGRCVRTVVTLTRAWPARRLSESSSPSSSTHRWNCFGIASTPQIDFRIPPNACSLQWYPQSCNGSCSPQHGAVQPPHLEHALARPRRRRRWRHAAGARATGAREHEQRQPQQQPRVPCSARAH